MREEEEQDQPGNGVDENEEEEEEEGETTGSSGGKSLPQEAGGQAKTTTSPLYATPRLGSQCTGLAIVLIHPRRLVNGYPHSRSHQLQGTLLPIYLHQFAI